MLIAAAIMLLALALRLRGLDTTALWGDQAFTLNAAMRWVNGGDMPLAANKSSVGFVNPPMIEYLYAAALWLWRDILSVSLLTLLGGLAAVAVTGFVTARLFGRRAGLWAMLAFAVAPWAVYWSQLIWNQTMVPPFAALALGGLLLYLADRPRWHYLVISFVAAAIMTQVHPGSAVQLLTIALALLLFRRRVQWRHVLVGALAFAALYLPYLVYQIGTGWADLGAMGDIAGQESAFSGAAALLSLDLIRAQGLLRAVPAVVPFDRLATALFLAALGLVVWRLWRNVGGRIPDSTHSAPDSLPQPSERIALAVLLLWFFMPLLFYLRSSVYLQNYYLLSQWPAHFMILGIGLDTARRAAAGMAAQATRPAKRQVWAVVGLMLPALFLLSAAYQLFFSLRYQDARAAGHDSLMQVRHARAMIAMSRELLAGDERSRLVGLGHGHQADNSDLALLQEFVDPRRVLLADSELALPLPRPYAFLLNTRPGSLAAYTLNDLAYPVPDANIQVGDATWQFYEWTEPEQGTSSPPAASWALGLDLAGYFPGEFVPGQETIVVLTWDINGPPPDALYHFGVYLLNERDEVVAQHDGPGFDSAQWRAGDRFITYHRLALPPDLPAGTYRVAAALYTWPDLVRAELRDGGNTAFLQTITMDAP